MARVLLLLLLPGKLSIWGLLPLLPGARLVLLSLQLPLPAEDEGEALVLNAGLGVALEEPGGAGGLQ